MSQQGRQGIAPVPTVGALVNLCDFSGFVLPLLFTPQIPPYCTSSGAICTMSALMIKAIFRLTEIEKQKIFKLREMGVRPPDIARRFGLSEGVVHKIIQAQRALIQPPKIAPQGDLMAQQDLHKQEAS